ncbi:hypothetical protein RJ639_012031 [Escallonia herrerae]|uniref:PWWP domain-containing protein n=1 Tax=Escallonia herrerae TaxID=1293975 RepID=A0AA88VLK5_9ASTE|nr:hypothetical protein RJ639_012031 [Escallonia herrerae]
MGMVGTKKTETLVGGDGGPIFPERVKSQTPEVGSGDAGAALDESGVWGSDTNHGVLNGDDSVVAKRRVVEIEVLIQTNLGNGSGSNLGVEKMEENRVQEIGENSGSSVLACEASGKENEEKSEFKDEKGSLAENGGVPMSEIYDPSDASDHALKFRQKDRLLVAYFGDSSFSWCNLSQLKPFAENFEEMSRQTISKSTSETFANVVQNALEDIGRLVELEMTCSCIPKEIRIQPGIAKPNGGIKSEVVVPNGGSGKHLTARHELAELLANVRSAAKGVFSANLLERVVLRSWLSAFYRAKGRYGLPVYREPAYIEGLEDKKRGMEIDTNDFSEPVEVPIEDDWLSSPAELGSSQFDQPLLSMVSGKKKRRRSEEAESQGDIVSTAERKRGKKKQPEVSDTFKTRENTVSRVDNARVGAEEATGSSLSREQKRRRVSFSPQTVDTNVKKFKERSSTELGSRYDDSGKSSPQTSDQDVDSIEVDANEVLSELRSAALNPLHFREKRRLDMISAFNSEFSSSNFSKRSNYHNGRAGRKRKSLNSEAGQLGKHLNQIAEESINCKTQPTAVASNGQAKSDMPKVKQGAVMRKRLLLLCQRRALSELQMLVIGSDIPLIVSVAQELQQKTSSSLRKTPEKLGTYQPSDVEASGLRYVRQELENMTSMLENSVGGISPRTMDNLEGQMKDLLEEVSAMVGTTSS